MKSLFRLIGEVSAYGDHALATAAHPMDEPEKHLFRFEAAVLTRGVNALKSVSLLCGEAHWETASGIVRQLFELVVNMEYIGQLPDRGEAVLAYTKYGLMQKIEFERSYLQYGERTGRDVDSERIEKLERMLAETFPEFRAAGSDGKLRKKPSWSGHKVGYLAEQSNNPMRKHQYHMLFRVWSEQSHSAPAALFDSILGSDQKVIVVQRDDRRIAEIVTMAISFFLELWMMLPHAPRLDPEKLENWTAALAEEARKYGSSAETRR